MLVLTRKKGEKIVIGDNIVLTVVDIKGDQIQLGIEAPRDIPVHREEVYKEIQEENIKARKTEELNLESIQKLMEKKKGKDGEK